MGKTIAVEPEPKKGDFGRNSTLMEMREASRLFALAYVITEKVVSRQCGGDKDSSEYKMLLSCAVNAPVRHIVINSGGRLPEALADCLLRQTETPGVPYIYKKLRKAADATLYKPLLLLALGGTEDDYLRYKAIQLISPEISLRPNCKAFSLYMY